MSFGQTKETESNDAVHLRITLITQYTPPLMQPFFLEFVLRRYTVITNTVLIPSSSSFVSCNGFRQLRFSSLLNHFWLLLFLLFGKWQILNLFLWRYYLIPLWPFGELVRNKSRRNTSIVHSGYRKICNDERFSAQIALPTTCSFDSACLHLSAMMQQFH